MEIHSAEAFVPYWKNIRKRTRRIVECIPEDHFDWTHRAGAWTFADIIRHLAGTERFMFAENARCRPSRYPGHGAELADGPTAVREYMDTLHAESCDIFGGLSADDLQLKCETPGGAEITVWKWLRAMVEHECHHRGQIYLMLGGLDVDIPQLYGLTEQEVRARSLG